MVKTSLTVLATLIALPAFASGSNEYTLNKSDAAMIDTQISTAVETYNAPLIATQPSAVTVTTVDPCTDTDPFNDAGCPIGELVYDTQPYMPTDNTTTFGLQPVAPAPSNTTIYVPPSNGNETIYYSTN